MKKNKMNTGSLASEIEFRTFRSLGESCTVLNPLFLFGLSLIM